MKAHLYFLCFIAAFGTASAVENRLSIFSILLLVIGFASLTRFKHEKKGAIMAALVVASLCTTVGIARFIWGEALPGIAEARGRATSKKAVSLLREVLFAQDALRRYGWVDPDGDKVGSAGRLGELSGTDEVRGKAKLKTPPLSIRYTPRVATKSGPANQQEGYLLLICLPGKEAGTWATHPSDPVDDELAERRWVAYAWPVQEGLGHETAYFINEHEEILESPNKDGEHLRLVGSDKAPDCTEAINAETKKKLARLERENTPKRTPRRQVSGKASERRL